MKFLKEWMLTPKDFDGQEIGEDNVPLIHSVSRLREEHALLRSGYTVDTSRTPRRPRMRTVKPFSVSGREVYLGPQQDDSFYSLQDSLASKTGRKRHYLGRYSGTNLRRKP